MNRFITVRRIFSPHHGAAFLNSGNGFFGGLVPVFCAQRALTAVFKPVRTGSFISLTYYF
jgi:hypothetical protein